MTSTPTPNIVVPSLTTPDGKVDEIAVALSVFSKFLAEGDLRAAMYALLRRTDYRFIGLFRTKDGRAAPVVYVDRENLAELQSAEVAETATYCNFVRLSGKPFFLNDSIADSRVQDHPAKATVRSYCGAPVMAPDGSCIGTLCHYDVVPRSSEQIDLSLLERACALVGRSGLVPEYPEPPTSDGLPGTS